MIGLFFFLFLVFYIVSVVALISVKFKWGMRAVGLVSVFLLGGMAALFAYYATPAFQHYGLTLLTSAAWNPVTEQYGLLPAITGTLLTSAIAVAVAMPLAVSVAVALVEFLPGRLGWFLSSLLDLTAAMPTVIFGLWGRETFGPALAVAVNWLASALLHIDANMSPYTLLTAALLLAFMITPYAAAVIREGYAATPKPVEEAIYSVGATRLEAIVLKLKYVRTYVAGGFFLALGRAMGETVAVAMVVGSNFVTLTLNPLNPGITISSLIALQFPNAAAYTYMTSVLFAAAFVLAVIGLAINGVSLYLLRRWQA